MKFTLQINVDGAAFQEGGKNQEVARILQEAADNVRANDSLGRIHDVNGNRVGFWVFEEGN